MHPSLMGELLRPLVDSFEQTACHDCGTPYLPGDLNCVPEPITAQNGSTTGISVRLLCEKCQNPPRCIPRQRRHLHSVR